MKIFFEYLLMTSSTIGKLFFKLISHRFQILKGLSATMPSSMKVSKFAQFHLKAEPSPSLK